MKGTVKGRKEEGGEVGEDSEEGEWDACFVGAREKDSAQDSELLRYLVLVLDSKSGAPSDSPRGFCRWNLSPVLPRQWTGIGVSQGHLFWRFLE